MLMSSNSICSKLSITTGLNNSSLGSSGRKFSSSNFNSKDYRLSFSKGLEFSNLLFSFAVMKIELYPSKLVNPNIHSPFSICQGISKEKDSPDFVKLNSKVSCAFV